MKLALTGLCSSLVVASTLLALSANATVVFQADFNGSGAGPDVASNIVTFGGTGVVNNANPAQSNVDVNFLSATPLSSGSGGYLSLNDKGTFQTNNRAAAITFKPTDAASSFDSWYTNTSSTLGYDTLNGGFDFLFRTTSSANLGNNTLRLLDINGGASGYRLILTTSATDKIVLQLLQNGTILATADSGHDSANLLADNTYRLGATVTTDSSGKVTLSLFMATGDTTIDTTSATNRIASATTASALDGSNSISSSFNSAAGFNFGLLQNSDADVKTVDLDAFRIYNSAPTSFSSLSSIPEPGTVALLMGTLIGAGVCFQRRR
jgi:hypothetical protein